MIQFNFNVKNGDSIAPLRDRLCEALVGSPAFINSEIAVVDGDDASHCSLIVGNKSENDKDMAIGIEMDQMNVIDKQEDEEEAHLYDEVAPVDTVAEEDAPEAVPAEEEANG